MKLKVGEPKKCVIYIVLYVPELACNLFSVGAGVDNKEILRSLVNLVKLSKA